MGAVFFFFFLAPPTVPQAQAQTTVWTAMLMTVKDLGSFRLGCDPQGTRNGCNRSLNLSDDDLTVRDPNDGTETEYTIERITLRNASAGSDSQLTFGIASGNAISDFSHLTLTVDGVASFPFSNAVLHAGRRTAQWTGASAALGVSRTILR